jgi:DMSO/TMAO reductase YedYZ molybdopterin-dependent catalytic subunit
MTTPGGHARWVRISHAVLGVSVLNDDWVACLDMYDALHPQTILAYGMNGRDLPIPARRSGPPARGTADRLQEDEIPKARRRDGHLR